jgi:hypothetical protein
MRQIYVDEALVPILKRIVGTQLIYGLFRLPAVPTRATVLAGFTIPTYTGYSDITVPLASFTLQGVVTNVGILQALPISFVPGSVTGETIYGYFVTDSGSSYCVGFAIFDVPYVVATLDPILVTPALSDFSKETS